VSRLAKFLVISVALFALVGCSSNEKSAAYKDGLLYGNEWGSVGIGQLYNDYTTKTAGEFCTEAYQTNVITIRRLDFDLNEWVAGCSESYSRFLK
jgi:hypothetical protein